MENKIEQIITKSNKALTYEEILDKLTDDEKQNLANTLINLQNNLKIRVTNKGRYEKFNDRRYKLGKFISNPKGYGFVRVDGEKEDYHISKENIRNALNGDDVIIKILDENKKEARIEKINKRNMKDLLVGEFYTKDGKNYIKLDDDKLNIILEVENNLKAVDGHKVIAKIISHTPNTNYYFGSLVKIIGHKDDPGVDILSIAAKHGIFEEFPDEVYEQLKTIPDHVLEEEYKGRRDLRDKMIFTIDGDDTKDIDDAISLEKTNENYILGVHIADVTYYVKDGTPLSDEAYKRGTSSYLANTVIPMLPHQLSNGICSLNPGVDRLTISCDIYYDKEGNIQKSEIYPSVIRSRKQMTYNNVNKILIDNTIPEGYEEFADKLKEMNEFSHILRKKMIKKGYLEFDIPEAKIICDKEGHAIDIKKRIQSEGEKLIENFMIACNEAVATTIYYMDLPFVYRVHGEPIEDKLKQFTSFVSSLGYKINANMKKITPNTVQDILKQLSDKPEASILSSMLLRSMQKAVYSSNNIGHFGLGSKCYTHFTSPIRRYPDEIVHKLIRKYLFEHQINNGIITYYNENLPKMCEYLSERERQADDCEREVTDVKMAEYMTNHIGEEYEGIIDTVTNYGFYVILDNLVEGLVRLEDLKGDYYIYLEDKYCIIGKRTKKIYKLGDKVKIKVINVDKDKGLVDFITIGDKDGNSKQKSQA